MISVKGKDYNCIDWWILKIVIEAGRNEVYKKCHRGCESCGSKKVCKDLDLLQDYVDYQYQYHEGK